MSLGRLFTWFYAARERLRTPRRFRDPVMDFGISATCVQALAGRQSAGRPRVPHLSEHGNYVSLFPGDSLTDGVHAVMDRTSPTHLVLSYTQIMAGFTRFKPTPQSIGILGLGGGSLAKYCYGHFADSRIIVAEISAEVIALRRQFLIPDDDGRFTILQADGAALVRQSACSFHVLLVDVFDNAGYPPRFATKDFYRDCYRALTKGGVLVLNLSGEDWKTWFRRLDKVFRGRTILYQCPDGDNVIVFATRGPLPEWSRSRS